MKKIVVTNEDKIRKKIRLAFLGGMILGASVILLEQFIGVGFLK